MSRVIPIKCEANSGSSDPSVRRRCTSCLHSSLGSVCQSELGPACVDPDLQGPEELIARVVSALDVALDVQRETALPAGGVIHSLRVNGDEAELTLGVARQGAGLQLAEVAFQTLRGLLPDTDIYVLHAA
jgi:hypothetical protein